MTLWVVRCGDGANEQEPISKGIVGIGWTELQDLAKLTEREQIQELYTKTYTTESIAQIRTNVAQIYSFRTRIQVGDYVALPLKKSASIAFGKVTSGRYDTIPSLYSKYGSDVPAQRLISEGAKYADKNFPKLSKIISSIDRR